MNNKLLPYIKQEGFCCLWAWFEAHRAIYTSVLAEQIKGVCTLRALQQQRAKYRHGENKCQELECCLKQKIKDARKTP